MEFTMFAAARPLASNVRFGLNAPLWVLQVLLALFFALASGAPKFLLPPEILNMPIPLPRAFVIAIGCAEVLGALGLVLPGVLHIRARVLTPLAACGLVLLTLCAATYQLLASQPGSAAFALVLGGLAAVVAYGRHRLVVREPKR
jgi:uncharacterized membrane protein